MKKKEIIKLTLKAYNTAIKDIKTKKLSFNRSLNYLEKRYLDIGVCKFIKRNCNVYTKIKWIDKYTKTTSYGDVHDFPSFWGKIPKNSGNRADMLISLELRKNILEEELKICK